MIPLDGLDHLTFKLTSQRSNILTNSNNGSTFTEDGRLDSEIETRCPKVSAVIYQLSSLFKHPRVNMNAKRQLINIIPNQFFVTNIKPDH